MNLRELPRQERPRERLAQVGEKNLSSVELLAIVLRTGCKGTSAVTLAQKLLVRHGGLRGIAAASLRELAQLPGMGETKAATLKAALELGRRLGRESAGEKLFLNTPETIFELYRDEMSHHDREILKVLHLDIKNQLIAEETASVGTLTMSLAHPREIFKKAIRNGAAAIILLHNHPSGDPTPSADDRETTKRIADAGKLLGISLLDHLIFGDGKYVSLKPV